MEFCASVFSHGVTEIPELTEGRNHPCTRLWIFVVQVRNVVGIFEEASRETQTASKSFVPANAFLFAERLLNQQLYVA
jgi:hypothetical protein